MGVLNESWRKISLEMKEVRSGANEAEREWSCEQSNQWRQVTILDRQFLYTAVLQRFLGTCLKGNASFVRLNSKYKVWETFNFHRF